jgi:GTPase SAR1 family protein
MRLSSFFKLSQDLIDEVKQRSAEEDDSNMADVSIWDFAGQYVFYATHQVFLSRRAVYLLVIDISKHMEDTVKDDDCFLDSKGVKHLKISGMPPVDN